MSFDCWRLLGVTTTGRDRSIRWIDPVMAEHQKTLDAASPASTVRIESYSRNLDKMLVRISTPDNPGLLYYYDAATGALHRLAALNEAIVGQRQRGTGSAGGHVWKYELIPVGTESL